MLRDESDERAERFLLELYDDREKLAASLKFATGRKLAEGQALLRKADADIDSYEEKIGSVQATAAALEAAYIKRRQKVLDLLPVLDNMESDPAFPRSGLEQLHSTRAASLQFLRDDAEQRGIPNDDH